MHVTIKAFNLGSVVDCRVYGNCILRERGMRVSSFIVARTISVEISSFKFVATVRFACLSLEGFGVGWSPFSGVGSGAG